MKELLNISIILFFVFDIAKAQSENQFAKQEPKHQNAYLSSTESPLNNPASGGLYNSAEWRLFASCDKIMAHTEFTPQGISIKPTFELKNAANKKLRLTAYFYYAEDTPMPAAYLGYSTSNCQLATWKDLELSENEVNINVSTPFNFTLLMPYNKMVLNRDLLNLKYFLALFDGDEKIQESDWIYFKIKNSKSLLSQTSPD
jgi:hypothetical protein